jgi:myo-inositol-1(or 4)-monophosphatase
MDVAALKPFVRELAAESGALIRRYFRSPGLVVDIKDDATPVTDADRGAEELLRKRILARFPDHGIMAEEFGTERGDAEWVWVLDPIDGTKSFVSGVPLFGTLIALLHHGQPVLGAIHQPILEELCLGDGTTTTLNDRPVRVRTTTRLQDAVVLASDTATAARHQSAAGWERLVASARWVRDVGRLLRLPPRRDGPGRRHDRSDHEPVGSAGAHPGDPRRRRRHHRLAGRRSRARDVDRRRVRRAAPAGHRVPERRARGARLADALAVGRPLRPPRAERRDRARRRRGRRPPRAALRRARASRRRRRSRHERARRRAREDRGRARRPRGRLAMAARRRRFGGIVVTNYLHRRCSRC